MPCAAANLEVLVFPTAMSGRSKQASAPEVSPMEETLTWLTDTLRDQAERKALLQLKGPNAQSLIDCLSSSLSNPDFREAAKPWLFKHTVIFLRKLCEVSMLYPTCHVIHNVQDISLQSGGGFCDIHRGRYNGQVICLKVVRLYQKSKVEDLLKAHAREAILWSSLDHPNIVPFYGIFYWENKYRICLVSPWMKNGDIVEYLERVPEAPRKPFVYEIANGLQYLHSQNIVHGDLKGRNVLIDDHRHACISDFGLSTIITDETLGFAATTTGTSGHTTRWASPELLEDDASPTPASDIWAFGCVCYEVLTRLSPFVGCLDLQVVSNLKLAIHHDLPAKLENATLDPEEMLNRKLRRLVEGCWSIEAKARPGCLEILRRLEKHCAPSFTRNSTDRRNFSHPRLRLSIPGSNHSTATPASALLSTSGATDQARKHPYCNTEEVLYPKNVGKKKVRSKRKAHEASPYELEVPVSGFSEAPVQYIDDTWEIDFTVTTRNEAARVPEPSPWYLPQGPIDSLMDEGTMLDSHIANPQELRENPYLIAQSLYQGYTNIDTY